MLVREISESRVILVNGQHIITSNSLFNQTSLGRDIHMDPLTKEKVIMFLSFSMSVRSQDSPSLPLSYCHHYHQHHRMQQHHYNHQSSTAALTASAIGSPLSSFLFDSVENTSCTWICPKCDFFNFSDSFFADQLNLENENRFDPLANGSGTKASQTGSDKTNLSLD